MRRARDPDAAVSPSGGASSGAEPGKRNLTQRMASGTAARPQAAQPHDREAAAAQRSQQDHDTAAAMGFLGGPAPSVDASLAVQRKETKKKPPPPPPDWTGKLVETMVATTVRSAQGLPTTTVVPKGTRARVLAQGTDLTGHWLELEGDPASSSIMTGPKGVRIARADAHVVDETMLPEVGERPDDTFLRDFKVVFANVMDEFLKAMPPPFVASKALEGSTLRVLFSSAQRAKLQAFFETRIIPEGLFTGADATGSVTHQQRILLAAHILATGHNEEGREGDSVDAPGKPRARNCGHWAGWVWHYAGVSPAGHTPSSNQGNILNVVGPTGAASFGTGEREEVHASKDRHSDGRLKPLGYPDEAAMMKVFESLQVGDWIWIDNRGSAGHSEIFAGWVDPEGPVQVGEDKGPGNEKETKEQKKARLEENKARKERGEEEIPAPLKSQAPGTQRGDKVVWKRAKVYHQGRNEHTQEGRGGGPGGGGHKQENLGFPYSETAADDKVCPVTHYSRPADDGGRPVHPDELLPFDRDSGAEGTHRHLLAYPGKHAGAEVDLAALIRSMSFAVEQILASSKHLARLDETQAGFARTLVAQHQAPDVYAVSTLFALVQRLSVTDIQGTSDPGRKVTGVLDPGSAADLGLIGTTASLIERRANMTSMKGDELSFPFDLGVEGNRVAIGKLVGAPEDSAADVALLIADEVSEQIGKLKSAADKTRYEPHAATIEGWIGKSRSSKTFEVALEDVARLVAAWQFLGKKPVTGFPAKYDYDPIVGRGKLVKQKDHDRDQAKERAAREKKEKELMDAEEKVKTDEVPED
jgi:hypothetical protein